MARVVFPFWPGRSLCASVAIRMNVSFSSKGESWA
ncbi:hypothetical protein SBADM41S_11473 [Streptomyces badius]